MGFGFLLIGYMFAFLISSVGFGYLQFAGLALGSIFMFFGLKELRKYEPFFIYAYVGNILLFVCSLFLCSVWILNGIFPENSAVSVYSNVVSSVKIAICLFYEVSMLLGIAALSKRVDYPDTRQKAYTNIIYVGVFNLIQILIALTPVFLWIIGLLNQQAASDLNAFITPNSGATMFVLVIAQLIYTGINTFLIFKCYAMICPVGQEDMPYKKSKFAFINKFREIRDAKDDKAIEEMKNYYEDKLKKRNAKRNAKNSKKKKKK